MRTASAVIDLLESLPQVKNWCRASRVEWKISGIHAIKLQQKSLPIAAFIAEASLTT